MELMQKIFDTAVGGVLKQGGRALNESRVCVLRGDNDTKCALGWLIDDDQYTKSLEFVSFMGDHVERDMENDDLADKTGYVDVPKHLETAVECSLGKEMTDDGWRLIMELQAIHDDPDADNMHHTAERFRQTAERWGISSSIIDTIPLPE